MTRHDQTQPARDIRILLVEHSPGDAEWTLHGFRERGFAHHVMHVMDGIAALNFLFGGGTAGGGNPLLSTRLVLLELDMPGLNGFEVLRRLKAHQHGSRIPVVILTRSRDERDLRAAYLLGANSYLVKPDTFQEYTDAVTRIGFNWISANEADPGPSLPESHSLTSTHSLSNAVHIARL